MATDASVKGLAMSKSTFILRTFSNLKFLVSLWALLFIMTIVASELNFRSLVAAFIAWCGGLLTAHLDDRLRSWRQMRQKVLSEEALAWYQGYSAGTDAGQGQPVADNPYIKASAA